MCGLAAWIGKTPVRPERVKLLFEHIAYRGRDAAGMAMYADGFWWIAKEFGPVTKPETMAAMLATVARIKPTGVLLHVRAATHGSPRREVNNHPIAGDHSICMHNGVVSLPEKFTATGDTDTEQMVRAIEAYGIADGLGMTRGSFAIMRVDLSDPREVQIVRNSGSPLQYFRGKRARMWASTPFKIGQKYSQSVPVGQLTVIDVRTLEQGQTWLGALRAEIAPVQLSWANRYESVPCQACGFTTRSASRLCLSCEMKEVI